MATLARLRAQNFGCFANLDLELAPLTVVVGQPSAGKSTLLQAVRLHRAVAEGAEDLASALAMPELIRRAGEGAPLARCESRLEWDSHLASRGSERFTLRLELAPRRPRGARLFGHQVRLGGMVLAEWNEQSGTRTLFTKHAPSGRMGAWSIAPAPSAETNAFSEWFERVHEELGRIGAYSLVPSVMRAPSPPARTDRVPLMSADGRGLATVLSVLSGAERERVATIERVLCELVPSVAGFRVLPTPAGEHRLVFVPKHGPSGALVEAEQIGDGALLLLGLLSIVFHPQPPSVLIMEEIERGLHPGQLPAVVDLLRRLGSGMAGVPATTVLATSYSPALLGAVEPREAAFVYRDAAGLASAARFADIPSVGAWLNDYSLGEIWARYGEERLSGLVRRPRQATTTSPPPEYLGERGEKP